MDELINIRLLNDDDKQALICLFYAMLSEADSRYKKKNEDWNVLHKKFNTPIATYRRITDTFADHLINAREGENVHSFPLDALGKSEKNVYETYKDTSDTVIEEAVKYIIEEYSIETSDFISMKCGIVDTVHRIIGGEKVVTIDGIYTLKEELLTNKIVFLTLGGDTGKSDVDWEPGFIGIAKILKEPYEFGYNDKPKYFKIDLEINCVFDRPFKREDFLRYLDAYDASYIGPELSRDPSQAISSLNYIKGIAVIRAVLDTYPALEENIRNIFGENFFRRVIGDVRMMLPADLHYKEVKPELMNSVSDLIFNHNLYGIRVSNQNQDVNDEDQHICIGWPELGDLSQIQLKEELYSRYKEFYHVSEGKIQQDVDQIWRFINDAQYDDYILFTDGANKCHIGRIASCCYYKSTVDETQNNNYKNYRSVVWLKKDIEKSVLSDALQKCLGTGMSFWTMNDYKSAVIDLLNGTYVKDEIIENEDMEDIMPLKYNTGILPELSRNRILFGAPGTGKSYRLESDRKELLNNDEVGGYERVTFHPDYTYSQFVGTYKPVTDSEGNIRYEFVPGPFMRVYVDALKSGMSDNPQPYILVIEEINRANVAAVFGDIFQLLDRDAENVSEYQIQASEDVKKYLADRLGGDISNYGEIKIPDNMFIWATMNSADQGVFPMDTAFKRRWDFTYLGINNNEDIISGKYVCIGQGAHERKVEWNELRKAINEVLLTECRVNEDKLMGPFFISMKNLPNDDEDSEKFIKVFKNKVLMYLFDDAGKQKRATLFDGCSKKNLYSAICEEFEEKGIDIFGNAVRSHFPMKDQLDSED